MGILEDLKEQHDIDGTLYNVDPSLHAHEGFAVGDHVECIQDDPEMSMFAGDTGEVVAITRTGPGKFNPTERIELLVVQDGVDPMTIDPSILEPLA